MSHHRLERPEPVPNEEWFEAIRAAITHEVDPYGSQRQMARALGISEKHVSHFVLGKTNGSPAMVGAMLNYLGITITVQPPEKKEDTDANG